MVLIAVGINAYKALIVSQVVLSLQLPLTVLPLLWLVRSRAVMGDERMGPYVAVVGAVLVTILIGLNGFLVYQTIYGR
jgi:manganese transport protein